MRYSSKQLAIALVDTAQEHSPAAAADALIALLAKEGELRKVRAVAEALDQVWKERYGAATVTIQTAHPLTAALRKRLETVASGAELRETVDPSLIGGARVRVDDRVVDGTIAGYLEQLRAKFAQ